MSALRYPKQGSNRLANGCAWNAASVFANCGRAVAHVQGAMGHSTKSLRSSPLRGVVSREACNKLRG